MILVVTGDLERQSVDAVVRPADATLAAVGAAAERLDAVFVRHVVVADERGPAGRERLRRALVSPWQRAGDWGLRRVAAPLVGTDGGLTVEESVGLLVETAPGTAELSIVVHETQRPAVEALVGRLT